MMVRNILVRDRQEGQAGRGREGGTATTIREGQPRRVRQQLGRDGQGGTGWEDSRGGLAWE